ncbi:P-loop containing nucleoside triphosphate hydrolase protein, partial [Calocera cornea HHB12733]
LTEQLVDGVLSFEYEGTAFEVFCASWRYSDWMASKGRTFQFVFHGTDDSAGKALVQAVYEWSQKLKDEIWVFSHGIWYKDEDLYKAIQAASWDDIVLEDGFTEGLKSDTETFFASEDVYGTLNIAWKRGILLLGPPGNGKTQTIEALLKDALDRDVPCLYVKTFKTERDEEWGIKEIFSKAREEAPCILVLEDLDAMVASKLRSYFLNELDGLAKNHGILTLATSNHPERIDDAILRRPSRFDQKYTFALPTPALREEYSRKWLAKVGKAGGFDFSGSGEEALAHKIAERTEDWSFAFLKELFVS